MTTYRDTCFNDPSIFKKNTDVDFNDRNLEILKIFKVNYQPAVDSHLTPKIYVDNAIDETSLVRNIQDNDSNNHKLTNINSITSITQALHDNQVFTKTYVDQFHQENERTRRDLGIDFYNESSDKVKNSEVKNFNDNKITNFDNIIVIRNATSDNEFSNKKYFDDQLGKKILLKLNQTLENYLKVFVGNIVYNLTKYHKI